MLRRRRRSERALENPPRRRIGATEVPRGLLREEVGGAVAPERQERRLLRRLLLLLRSSVVDGFVSSAAAIVARSGRIVPADRGTRIRRGLRSARTHAAQARPVKNVGSAIQHFVVCDQSPPIRGVGFRML